MNAVTTVFFIRDVIKIYYMLFFPLSVSYTFFLDIQSESS